MRCGPGFAFGPPASGMSQADADLRYVNKTTPVLGGNLNAGGYNVTNVGTLAATEQSAPYYSQAAPPPDPGAYKWCFWHNTDTGGVFIVFHDPTVGLRWEELTGS